ncbi:MAG: hypothetical protein J6Q15_01980, partial [Clostridia bacterium]|nr:hypothetical protein [Clostridia bacterium]
MDNKSNKTTNRTKRPASSPMSAEEKLKRSMKGLSYTGSSATGSKLSAESNTKTQKASSRKKVGGVVLDLDTIQDANKQKLETKGRRNNVIILVLSLLLVVSLVYLVIAIMNYNSGKKEPNLKYRVEGEAEWIIEGSKKTDYLLPQGLASDMLYTINSDLKITTNDSVTLVVEIEVLLDGEEVLLAGITGNDEKLVRVADTNRFVYQGTITGGATIEIFDCLDFS